MIQFNADKFSYNGISSEKWGLIMVELDNNDGEIISGNTRIVNMENGIKDIKIVTSQSVDYIEVKVSLLKLKNGYPVKFTEDDLFEINYWLCARDDEKPLYKPLEFNDYCVNACITSSVVTNNGMSITLTLSCEPYIIKKIVKKLVITYSKQFDLKAKFNVYKDDNITNLKIDILKGDYIHINNLTNGKKYCIDGLSDEKTLFFDIDNLYVYNPNNSKQNLRPKITNNDWDTFKLRNGLNIFEIECNKCKLELNYEEKIQHMRTE